MAPDDDTFDPTEEHGEFVPAIFARSVGEAEAYCELLDDHDIPAIVGNDKDREEDSSNGTKPETLTTRGVPVLVPAVMLHEASEIVADREEVGEFEIETDEAEHHEDEDDQELDVTDGFFVEDVDGPLHEDDKKVLGGEEFDEDTDEEDDDEEAF